MAEAADNVLVQFTEKIGELDYEGQARWFLNAFWEDIADTEDLAEQLWVCCQTIRNTILAEAQGSSEHALDVFGAARLWEAHGEALTAMARKAKLKKIDVDNDNMMSLWEYAINKYEDIAPFKGHEPLWAVKELMTRPQGTNEELEKAKKTLAMALKKGEEYKATMAKLEAEVENSKGKSVAHNRAKHNLKVHQTNDIFTDAAFNKEYLGAKAAVKKAAKAENKTCQGDLWWGRRSIKEAEKYKAKGNLRR